MVAQQLDDIRQSGERAPDFELRGTAHGDLGTFTLAEYTEADNWVVLTVYAFDFNPICTAGMCALRDAEFFEVWDDVVALGVSGDGPFAHQVFAERNDIDYPLLSDTGRDVADAYGVCHPSANGMRRVHERSVFLIDPSRTVRFSAAVDADSPEDIDLQPVNEALKEHRQ
jgi:peroxiredoxin